MFEVVTHARGVIGHMDMRSRWLPVLGAATLASTAAGQTEVSLPVTDRPLRVSVTPQYEVGGMGAPDWAQLSGVDDVAFDTAGNLYLLDARNRQVLVVGPNGQLLRTLGGEGRGPGEFAAPRSLAVFPAGMAAVLDVAQRRISVFSPAGASLRDIPSNEGMGAPRTIVPIGPDAIVGDVGVFNSGGEQFTRSRGGRRPVDHRPLQRYDLSSGQATVVHRARLAPAVSAPDGGPRLSAFRPAFHMVALADGRLLVSDTGAYRLDVIDPERGVRETWVRGLRPRPVTEAHREAERRRLHAELDEGRFPIVGAVVDGGGAAGVERMRRARAMIDEMYFPASFPAIASLRSDPAGRVWVERYGIPPATPGAIDVLAMDGSYVGTVAAGELPMPSALGPEGRAAFVELDALDVPTVRVVRVQLVR